jgi:glycosyltransferase involved in cell wall biosynthesis
MSARYFDRVIAISASVKDFLIYSGEIRESSKISIINYGFNPGRFALSADSQGVSEKLKGLLENAQNSVLIGMVSRLDKEKRIDLALSAVSELVKTNPNVKLIIVGEGRLRGELEDQVRSLNLEDYVFLVGKQESIAYFMQRIDIFLHTSFFEGFGMVFLEAMAMNLPIIAYKSAGAVEVLGLNGAATFFVTPGDLVRRLKEYDPRIKTLSSSQQDLKLQQYLISETANKTEIVYQEISN